jgi:pimeloyl-ACP methyl ester carboxylesterase
MLQNAAGMSPLARHVSPRCTAIVPDLRGRGETTFVGADYSPRAMADDVAALIRDLDVPHVVVIGRNHGGVVGYHLAANHPGLVRGLVLGDTTPEVDEARAARRVEVLAAIPRSFESIDEAVAFYIRGLGLSEARARHDIPFDLVERDGQWHWQHDLDVIVQVERAAAPRADWDVLARIEAPTLVLRGQRGRIPVPIAERMQSAISQVEVQTVFGAGPDVFLGPGSEQAIGAIDLFLMRLSDAVTA